MSGRPAVSAALGEFAAQLLAEREVIPRAQAIADKAAERLPGAAVAVYLYNADELPPWTVKATVGEVTMAEMAKVPRRPCAGFLEGYQSTVTAIKANEAILTGKRIELKPEWYEIL